MKKLSGFVNAQTLLRELDDYRKALP